MANVEVLWEVTQGGGKLLNHRARWCRDNTGNPLTAVCPEDKDAAQSVEVPATLDVGNHYGDNVCGLCALSGAVVTCPAGWTPDDQCPQLRWWTNWKGSVMAEWIMGPNPSGHTGEDLGPFPQGLRITLPAYPGIAPLIVTGEAIDLAPHDLLPSNLSLASRSNKSVQPAGATMPFPFRAYILYRHDAGAIVDGANPLVRVDDDLMTEDKPSGEFRVAYYVTQGGLSDSPVRRGEEVKSLELPLEDNAGDPVDRAKAFWHLDCFSGPGRTIFMQAIHFSPYIADSARYASAAFDVSPSPTPCVEQGNLLMVDATTYQPLDRMPHSPSAFRIKAISSNGDFSPLSVRLISYDRNLDPIVQPNATDPDKDPFTIELSIPYSATMGYHVSSEMEALTLASAGMQSLTPYSNLLPLSLNSYPVTFLVDTMGGVTNFSCLGGGAYFSDSKVFFTSDGLTSIPFSEVRDSSAPVYLRLELGHDPSEPPSPTYSLPYR